MARPPFRPTFQHGDKLRLIDVLRETRRQVLLCAAAENTDSDLSMLCHAVTESLDNLALGLTGDRKILLSPLLGTAGMRPKDRSSETKA